MKHKKHSSPVAGKDAAPTAEAAANAAAPGNDQPAPPPPPSDAQKKTADERYLRLMADFENFRKRTLREKNDLYRTANEDFLLELLPVLDHMELALDSARKGQAGPGVLDGFTLVSEQLSAVIKKFGVTPIEADGQAFDPVLHEAISHLASDTVPDNVVIQQTRRGYMLGDKLLRPAQVVVSSGRARPAAPTESEAGSAEPPRVAPEPTNEG
mgnify:CR=1 FL=1